MMEIPGEWHLPTEQAGQWERGEAFLTDGPMGSTLAPGAPVRPANATLTHTLSGFFAGVPLPSGVHGVSRLDIEATYRIFPVGAAPGEYSLAIKCGWGFGDSERFATSTFEGTQTWEGHNQAKWPGTVWWSEQVLRSTHVIVVARLHSSTVDRVILARNIRLRPWWAAELGTGTVAVQASTHGAMHAGRGVAGVAGVTASTEGDASQAVELDGAASVEVTVRGSVDLRQWPVRGARIRVPDTRSQLAIDADRAGLHLRSLGGRMRTP